MVEETPGSIVTFEDLYAYFRRHPDEYRMDKCEPEVIAVYRLDASGEPSKQLVTHPEVHEILCVHYFHAVEVRRSNLRIPSITIEEIVKKLRVPRMLFCN